MPPRINIVGKRFSRLVVLSDRDENGALLGTPSNRQVRIRCDCGKEKITCARAIRRGRVRSCGCLQRESAIRHGLYKVSGYSVWNAILNRCYRKDSPAYRWYGARGIKVCDEWRNSPDLFIDWFNSQPKPEGRFDIDRIDNNGNYHPNNCRLVTRKQNNNNRRDNKLITVFGETLTIPEASEKFKICYDVLSQRIKKLGWLPERAVSTPVRKLARRAA